MTKNYESSETGHKVQVICYKILSESTIHLDKNTYENNKNMRKNNKWKKKSLQALELRSFILTKYSHNRNKKIVVAQDQVGAENL